MAVSALIRRHSWSCAIQLQPSLLWNVKATERFELVVEIRDVPDIRFRFRPKCWTANGAGFRSRILYLRVGLWVRKFPAKISAYNELLSYSAISAFSRFCYQSFFMKLFRTNNLLLFIVVYSLILTCTVLFWKKRNDVFFLENVDRALTSFCTLVVDVA